MARPVVAGLLLLLTGWLGAAELQPAREKPVGESWEVIKKRWNAIPLAETRAAAESGDVSAMVFMGRSHYDGTNANRDFGEAMRWWKMGAAKGNPNSENNLGILYETGSGVTVNLQEAIRFYKLAAAKGFEPALKNLGRADYFEAARLYELAAEKGDVDAQAGLGRLYTQAGSDGNFHTEQAIYWLTQAAAQNHGGACHDIGWFYLKVTVVDSRRIPQSPEEALRWFRTGAERGDPLCEMDVGLASVWEWGVKQDFAEAKRWLLKSAAHGNAAAEYQLGEVTSLRNIRHGKEVTPEYDEAAKWYRLAGEHGDSRGWHQLGMLAVNGQLKKGEEGLPYLKRAADAGERQALLDLARLYSEGRAPAGRNSEDALKVYRQLAANGNGEGFGHLGRHYRNGKDVPKDPLRAFYFAHQAAGQGEEESQAWLAEIRAAVEGRGRADATARDLAEKYVIYRKAVYQKDAAAAKQIAGWYRDGTLPEDATEERLWLRLATEHVNNPAGPGRMPPNPLVQGTDTEDVERRLRRLVSNGRWGL